MPAIAPISWKLPAIEHAIDALAHGKAAALVLARNAFRATQFLGQRDARAEFGEFGLPADRMRLVCGRGEAESSGIDVVSCVWRQLVGGPQRCQTCTGPSDE